MLVLGINAAFHESAVALVRDGHIVAAAEEERFSRRKHAKRPVPFSAWELPDMAIRWALGQADVRAADIDAVAYSYDPDLVGDSTTGIYPEHESLRTDFIRRAPRFLTSILDGFADVPFSYVRHHVAHAASAGLLHPGGDCAVLAADGRGEATSMIAGEYIAGQLKPVAQQCLPHSLGLLYEDLCEHLGFSRASDEYKVMALASYDEPRFAEELSPRVGYRGDGGFSAAGVNFEDFGPPRLPGQQFTADHADLAATVQNAVEQTLLDLCDWLAGHTGSSNLALAGGTALNCVANTRIFAESPFESVWVQPAAGDSGTALGAALTVAVNAGDTIDRAFTPYLGSGYSDDEIAAVLVGAGIGFTEPSDVAAEAAQILAEDGVIGWFNGRAEFGPRALGHRSLLANPADPKTAERLNCIKGREQFRPVAPMVRADRVTDIFSRGPSVSPYMLFVHDVEPDWRDRIPAVVHVDGSARIQTVDPANDATMARLLTEFELLTGLPVLVNTSLNTAGRPMVDSVIDALELFGSAPLDAMVLGPFLVQA